MSERDFKTSGSYDLEESIDLEACHTDPIHQTALIQPHGVFLELDPDRFLIQSASDNTIDHLNQAPSELLEGSLSQLLETQAVEAIKERCSDLTAHQPKTQWTHFEELPPGSLFRMKSSVGMELEPQENRLSSSKDLSNYFPWIDRFRNSESRDELFEQAVQAIYETTDLDRVMLYQFNEEGHGTVRAEIKEEGIRSYLNHRFPASDIPQPARRLYRKNILRYIPRVDYEPVPIRGPDGPRDREEMDLTLSSLRNVPRVHREYLQNMDVEGTLSCSLMVEDSLWGLIVGHSKSPLSISKPTRDLCGHLAHGVSHHLDRLEAQRRKDHHETLERIPPMFEEAYEEPDDLFQSIHNHEHLIRSLMDASAFCLILSDQTCWLSEGEDIDPLRELLPWIQHQFTEESMVSIRSIQSEWENDWDHSDRWSGFLAVRLNPRIDAYCVWFRPEERETIRWGGDPRSPVTVDETGELHPRNSFEEWTQIVEERSAVWSELDVLTARRFARVLSERYMEIQTHQLHSANQQKDTLMQELHHRVKNNFQLASSLLGLQKQNLDDDNLKQTLETVRSRLDSMVSLHRTLHQHEAVEEVSMDSYLREIIDTVAENFEAEQRGIRIQHDLADRALPSKEALHCGLILSELLSNSFEHGFTESSSGSITVRFDIQDGEANLFVEDTGTGWEQDWADLKTESLGLQLVESLATQQLNGRL